MLPAGLLVCRCLSSALSLFCAISLPRCFSIIFARLANCVRFFVCAVQAQLGERARGLEHDQGLAGVRQGQSAKTKRNQTIETTPPQLRELYTCKLCSLRKTGGSYLFPSLLTRSLHTNNGGITNTFV